MSLSVRRFLMALIGIALLRALLFPFTTSNPNPGPDGHDYLRVARDFLREPYPWKTALGQTDWAPGWPAVMAVLFSVFGDSMMTLRVANALLFCATLWLCHRLVRRIFDGDVALLATALVGWDNLVNFVKYANYEPLLTFLVTAALVILMEVIHGATVGLMAVAGALAAYSCLVQGKCLVPLSILGLWTALRIGRDGPDHVRRGLLALGIFASAWFLVVLPYCLRNYQAEGRFSFVASVGPPNLLIGNGPHANGAWTWMTPRFVTLMNGVSPDQRMGVALRFVLDRFRAAPAWFLLENLPRKFYWFWGLDTVRHNLYLVLMVAGMAWGLGLLKKSDQFLLWFPVASLFGLHMVFYGFERYRYPVLPGIHAYVALALLTLWSWYQRSAAPRTPALAALSLILLLPVQLLAILSMREKILHGEASYDDRRNCRLATIWTTLDRPYPIALVRPDGSEVSVGPVESADRRGQNCYSYTLSPEPASGRVRFRVKARDGSGKVVYAWEQELPSGEPRAVEN